MPRFFEDLAVGDRIVTPARTITEADVVAFAQLTGDWNPIHTDVEFAKTTPYGQRLAHGLLGLSYALGLLDRTGASWSVCGRRDRLTLPKFIGAAQTVFAWIV